jgi:hypothetical protein
MEHGIIGEPLENPGTHWPQQGCSILIMGMYQILDVGSHLAITCGTGGSRYV